MYQLHITTQHWLVFAHHTTTNCWLTGYHHWPFMDIRIDSHKWKFKCSWTLFIIYQYLSDFCLLCLLCDDSYFSALYTVNWHICLCRPLICVFYETHSAKIFSPTINTDTLIISMYVLWKLWKYHPDSLNMDLSWVGRCVCVYAIDLVCIPPP